jgi:hypothetical protein
LSRCKRGAKCIYAHTFKELNPIPCKWNEECVRKQTCYYKHDNETKIQYVKRAFPQEIKRLNIILHEKKHNTKIKENPIIEIENNEEFDEEGYKKLARNLYLMYYDPVFEHYSWEDINEFDSDNDRH